MQSLCRTVARKWHQPVRPVVIIQQRTSAVETRFEARRRSQGSKRYLKRKDSVLPPEEGGVTFQFAGDEARGRGSRLYVWGNAQYGALGHSGFLMPRSPKLHILTQMHKPYRWDSSLWLYSVQYRPLLDEFGIQCVQSVFIFIFFRGLYMYICIASKIIFPPFSESYFFPYADKMRIKF